MAHPRLFRCSRGSADAHNRITGAREADLVQLNYTNVAFPVLSGPHQFFLVRFGARTVGEYFTCAASRHEIVPRRRSFYSMKDRHRMKIRCLFAMPRAPFYFKWKLRVFVGVSTFLDTEWASKSTTSLNVYFTASGAGAVV